MSAITDCQKLVDEVYQRESRRVFATLVRLLGDFDLAEEGLQEAFAAALRQWPQQGVPANPRAWLVSAGRFKAIDLIRRDSRFKDRLPQLAERADEIAASNAEQESHELTDDRLRLIFTCCHPSLPAEVQIALTLREVCGLTTEEVAGAFLVSGTTMAQRIVRGKAKIRKARIPYKVPEVETLPERLNSVLSVIYLVFNEGYSSSSGEHLTRPDLSGEAIRLGRLLLELLPEPEVMGLLALMLLHESRRRARSSAGGDVVLLEDQDRALWDQALIAEGKQLVEQALATQGFSGYTLQAAISAVHAEAARAEDTDWAQITALYGLLMQVNPSPVVALNRAVAIAMADGPAAGISLIEAILDQGHLSDYYLAHSALADLYRRLGQTDLARSCYVRALELVSQKPERRFLERRLLEVSR